MTELPQPVHVGWEIDGNEPVYAYTADQLREYAQAAVLAEREACAKLLDDNADQCTRGSMNEYILRSNAHAIRTRGEETS